MLQRTLGRGVEIVTSGAPLARQVEHVLGAPRARQPAPAARATTRFLSTGDVDAFRALGTRFLQMPLGPVEHVDLRAAGGGMSARERSGGRARRRAAAGHDRARLRAPRDRLGADLLRRDARDLHRVGRRSRVPRWMTGKGRGWLTAEYGMLPASTGDRKQRDVSKGRPDGRTVEIQRLIGRSLRGVVDFEALGERTIYIDCDVLQADGGTRCASITGGYVALELACRRLRRRGQARPSCRSPARVAAVSCGVVDGEPLLDLDYPEDSSAEVDANVVMTGDGGLVEVQATAERTPLSRAHLDELLALAAARASRGCARPRPPRRRSADVPGSSSRPATPTSCASSSACCPTRELEPLPDDVELPPETGDTFAENALDQGARGRRGHRRAGDRRRLRHRGRGARRPPRRALGPLRRRRRDRRREPRQAARRGARRQSRLRYVCVDRLRRRRAGAEHSSRARCEGRMAAAPRGERRLRLRPGLRPRRRRRRPHDGRARRRREGRASRTAAAPHGRRRHGSREPVTAPRAPGSRSRARRALDRLELRADPAQDRGRRRHRLGRDHHRGDPLGDRPARLDRRLLLRPPGRDARRRLATATATRSSRTSPPASRGC